MSRAMNLLQDVHSLGHTLTPDEAGEVMAEVERLHKHGSDLNSELLDVRIKHVGEKDELRREIERLKADPRLVLTRHNLKVIQDALAYRFPQHGPTQGLVDAALAALAGEGDKDE